MTPARLAVALCAAAFLGSAPADDSAEGAPRSATVAFPSQFQPGRVYVYRLAERFVIADQAEGAGPIETNQTTIARIEAPSSGAALRGRINRIQWRLTGSGGPLEFDSQSPTPRRESKEFASLRAVVGREVRIELDAGGRAAPADAAAGADQDADPDQGAEARIRRILALLTEWRPARAVAVGEAWGREESLPIGLVNVVRKSRLEVESIENSRVHVLGQIEISGRASEGLVREGARTAASIVPSRPGECRIVYDAARGRLERLESRIAYDMRIHRTPLEKKDGVPTVSSQRVSAASTLELIGAEADQAAN